ncbi:hypothetical protein SAMN05428642_102779 [Flaviramulus basaltis]|uniref:Uncharacterized protein n=1 Tax=Flaviramulus basaltis TaxID=369401 RepID=A0A1K2IJB4_9FLAO|nr:hypothetical protein [Flaviramulus basaltis]SFZ92529.1 hypothetical protein SAMN05428642_102779 [Flaviramulus basaltis]
MQKNRIHNINKTGFKTPQDYFNNLEDAILSEIKLKESINNSGFKIPESYFDTFESRVMNQISDNETPKVISLFNKRTLVYVSSIAAAVLLLFNLSIFNKDLDWNKLDTETVENYMINEDISSYEIASLLSDEDLKEENFITYNLNEENVETYLLNNLDIDDIIE